jgi:transposase
MSPSSTLDLGMDVHKDSMAVADVAQEHGAEVTYLGTIGTRQGDMDQLSRRRPSKATQLIGVYEAGPCGSWLYRYLSKTGDDGWVVAPSLMPKTPGDRVTTDPRDAVPWARRARSGDLTAVDGPTVADEAMRDLTRARDDAIRALTDAKWRRNAFVLRHALRATSPAHGGAAHRRWRSEVVGHTPAPPSVCHADVRAVKEHRARLQRLEPARQDHVNAWR